MIDAKSGAEVWWDGQIGSFSGRLGDLRVGTSGGDITTVGELEHALGVFLDAQVKAALNEQKAANPTREGRRFVSKLVFMDLFRPESLVAIYDAARTNAFAQIELDRVTRAPNDEIELTDQRTMLGLAKMEQAGFIPQGDADRIHKGIYWQ